MLQSFRHTVFDFLHSLSHPRVKATIQLVSTHYLWPGMKADLHTWAHFCLTYQEAKVQWHTIAPISTFAIPDACFNIIHVNIVGPLPPSRAFGGHLKHVCSTDCGVLRVGELSQTGVGFIAMVGVVVETISQVIAVLRWAPLLAVVLTGSQLLRLLLLEMVAAHSSKVSFLLGHYVSFNLNRVGACLPSYW